MRLDFVANTTDISLFESTLDANRKRQLPFIWQQTLNHVAFNAMNDGREQIAKDFHKPKKFTQSQVRFKKASKADIKSGGGSSIFLTDNGKYLAPHITGSSEQARRGHLITPVNLKLNASGNIPGLRNKKPLGNKSLRTRSGKTVKPEDMLHVPINNTDPRTRHLPPGLYWRVKRTDSADGSNLVILARYETTRDNDVIFDWRGTAADSYRTNLVKCYRESARRAFATMKNKK